MVQTDDEDWSSQGCITSYFSRVKKEEILSGALEKLAKNDNDPRALVKKEISAILYMCSSRTT